MVEIDTSNHELYTPNFNNQGIFPFLQTNEDTSKFFRYIKIDSNDAIKNLYFPDWSNNNTPYLNYAYHLTLLNDTGIVKLVGSKNDNFGWRWDNYDLVEFRYSYPFPYLMIPQKFISLSTLSGTPKDTTIKIVNEGLQTLQITNVVSSDPHFLAVNFTDSIPPSSDGSITIQFNSDSAATISAVLTINCSSLNTDNTIHIIGNSYDQAVIDLQPPDKLDFGVVYDGQSKEMTYQVSNKGNIELKIYSIQLTNQVFKNDKYSFSVEPHQTITDTVYFSPNLTSEYSGELTINSNSLQSPNIIHLYGTSFAEPNVSVSLRSIYLGSVSVGSSRDSMIILTNNGNEGIYFNSFFRSLNPNDIYDEFSFVNGAYVFYNTGEIKPHSSINEIIRFTPVNLNQVNYVMIHEFYIPNVGTMKIDSVLLIGNVSDFLSQNYPNPFNGTTKIRFQVVSNSIVKIKIYDILGREVYTVLNEQLAPGSYEKTFNGGRLASGIYICRLTEGGISQIRKMLLLK